MARALARLTTISASTRNGQRRIHGVHAGASECLTISLHPARFHTIVMTVPSTIELPLRARWPASRKTPPSPPASPPRRTPCTHRARPSGSIRSTRPAAARTRPATITITRDTISVRRSLAFRIDEPLVNVVDQVARRRKQKIVRGRDHLGENPAQQNRAHQRRQSAAAPSCGMISRGLSVCEHRAAQHRDRDDAAVSRIDRAAQSSRITASLRIPLRSRREELLVHALVADQQQHGRQQEVPCACTGRTRPNIVKWIRRQRGLHAAQPPALSSSSGTAIERRSSSPAPDNQIQIRDRRHARRAVNVMTNAAMMYMPGGRGPAPEKSDAERRRRL